MKIERSPLVSNFTSKTDSVKHEQTEQLYAHEWDRQSHSSLAVLQLTSWRSAIVSNVGQIREKAGLSLRANVASVDANAPLTTSHIPRPLIKSRIKLNFQIGKSRPENRSILPRSLDSLMTVTTARDDAAETWTTELLMTVTHHASAHLRINQSKTWAHNLWKIEFK